jgi:adenylate cyclase
VLEGSVRKAGNRLRITVQLIDATSSGAHTWADRFEGALEDVFAFQDEVTVKAVAAIAPRVERAEVERAKRRPPGNTDAYDCYLRGLSCLSPISGERTVEAMPLFAQASALDPDYAAAYAMTMWCHAIRLGAGLVEDIEYERSEVTRLLRIIVRVGQEDGMALSHAAWTVAYVLRDLSSAKQLIDRAIELNPNLATAWASSGWINIWLGHPEVALEHLGRAQRLDPGQMGANPRGSALAHALFFLDRFEEALAVVEQVLSHSPDHHPALRIGVASAALAGDGDEAHRLAAHLQSVDPTFAVSRVKEYLGPYQKAEFVEKYAQGLRLAGLPE